MLLLFNLNLFELSHFLLVNTQDFNDGGYLPEVIIPVKAFSNL